MDKADVLDLIFQALDHVGVETQFDGEQLVIVTDEGGHKEWLISKDVIEEIKEDES